MMMVRIRITEETMGTPDDQAQYAALEAEMAKPADDLAGFAAAEPVTPDYQPAEQYQQPQQQHQPQEYQQQQQYQQPAHSDLPDVNEDPISHFEARAQRAENVIDQLQNEQIWNRVRADENRMR